MRLLLLSKFPPIAGGTSTTCYWSVIEACGSGHEIDIVTNSQDDVDANTQCFTLSDQRHLDAIAGLRICTTLEVEHASYFPWANPSLTKLIGAGFRLAENVRPDIIVGWYFEPYGLAASIIGRYLDIPVFIIHSGSDLGLLSRHPDLATAYRMAFRYVQGVLSGIDERTRTLLQQLGLSDDKIIEAEYPPLPSVYRKRQEPLSIDDLISPSENCCHEANILASVRRASTELNQKRLLGSTVTIGIFGKVGTAKSSAQTLAALRAAVQSGKPINVIAAPAGTAKAVTAFLETIWESPELQGVSWILPPLAPWRMPAAYALCDIVCHLENGCPIPFHASQVCREVLASSAALLCTSDSLRGSGLLSHVRDFSGAIIIDDANDVQALKTTFLEAIRTPEHLTKVSARGNRISQLLENNATGHFPLLQIIRHVEG